jgi:hypothetical protein
MFEARSRDSAGLSAYKVRCGGQLLVLVGQLTGPGMVHSTNPPYWRGLIDPNKTRSLPD